VPDHVGAAAGENLAQALADEGGVLGQEDAQRGGLFPGGLRGFHAASVRRRGRREYQPRLNDP
jgi:hypothetical protein